MSGAMLLIPLGIFVIITVVVLLVFSATAPQSAAETRLQELGEHRPRESLVSKAPEPSVVRDAVMSIGQSVARGDESKLRKKLITANFRTAPALPMFLGIRTLISFGPAAGIILPRFLSGAPMGNAWNYGLGAFLLGHFGCNYWLSQKSENRIREITTSLPDVLDLLVVCIEAGLGLTQAIQRVGDERSSQGDTLGRELSQVHMELRAGREREEALHDLGARNGSEDLRSLMALVIQSQRLGASMGQTLRAHADLLRTKRRQRAEEAARKLPIKMIIPLGTMLLPPLFIVVIGPPAMTFFAMVDNLTKR